MIKLKNMSFIFLATVFAYGCGNKKKEVQENANGYTAKYFKNVHFNVKGYLTQGINPLDEDIVKLTDAFKLIYDKNDKLVEVQFVIKGRLEDSYTYGFAKQVFRYTDSSMIFAKYDKFGKKLAMSRANGNNTIFEKEVIFKDKMPTIQRGLNFDGKPLQGFIRKKYECDSLGQIVWESNIDQFGKTLDITRREGVFYRKYEYTKEGWLMSNSFYEIKEVPRSLGGIHLIGYTYNSKGNITKNGFYNQDLVLTAQNGSEMAYRLMKYNEFGNLIEQSFYSTEDKLVIGEKGFARQKSKFDKNTNNTLSEYFAIDGSPIKNKEIGAFAERLTYDDRGDLVMSEFLDENKELMMSSVLNYSYKALEYNDKGLIVSEAYFGVDNKPMEFKGLGAHVKVSKYDSLERLIETRFLNTDNQSFLHPACGCAAIQFMHDSLGQVTKEKYVDLKGNLSIKGPKKVAIRKYNYDKMGNLMLIEYFDANEEEIVIEGNRPAIQ